MKGAILLVLLLTSYTSWATRDIHRAPLAGHEGGGSVPTLAAREGGGYIPSTLEGREGGGYAPSPLPGHEGGGFVPSAQ